MAEYPYDQNNTDEQNGAAEYYLDKTEETKGEDRPTETPEDLPDEPKSDVPFSGERYTFSDLTGKNRPGNTGFSVLSVILAGLSVLFGFLQLFIPAVIFALLGAGFALLSRKRLGYFDVLAIVGLFLAIFGAIVATFYFVLSLAGFAGPTEKEPISDGPKPNPGEDPPLGPSLFALLRRFF